MKKEKDGERTETGFLVVLDVGDEIKKKLAEAEKVGSAANRSRTVM